MAAKEKDKSLLEIAIDVLKEKHKPQPIMQVAKETMERKGLKLAAGKEALPQFLADFMESGYFVYCGDGLWDLKERQSTAVLDKDGSDFDVYENVEEDVKENELKDDDYDESQTRDSRDDDDDDNDEDDEIKQMLDDGSKDGAGFGDIETGFEEYEGEEDED